MPHVDLGNAPSWLTAFSLTLAFGIFIRDRRNSDRAQVDHVGVWFTETYERRMPGVGENQARIEEANIEVHVRTRVICQSMWSSSPTRCGLTGWSLTLLWSLTVLPSRTRRRRELGLFRRS